MSKVTEKIESKFRYGLVLKWVFDRLAGVGIQISPYYLVEERPCVCPASADDFKDFTFDFLTADEVRAIAKIPGRGITEQTVLGKYEKGKLCYGAKYKGNIAAFTWVDLEECHCKYNRFPLRSNEAYLFDMWTMKPFRGKNIAPYLRYRTYQVLLEMKREVFYSITEYFNTPSIMFKKKLGAACRALCLYLELFEKHHWHWVLREYGKAERHG